MGTGSLDRGWELSGADSTAGYNGVATTGGLRRRGLVLKAGVFGFFSFLGGREHPSAAMFCFYFGGIQWLYPRSHLRTWHFKEISVIFYSAFGFVFDNASCMARTVWLIKMQQLLKIP